MSIIIVFYTEKIKTGQQPNLAIIGHAGKWGAAQDGRRPREHISQIPIASFVRHLNHRLNHDMRRENPALLALMYDAPILVLLGECDRHPEKEKDIMDTLERHVRLFYQLFHQEPAEGGGAHD